MNRKRLPHEMSTDEAAPLHSKMANKVSIFKSEANPGSKQRRPKTPRKFSTQNQAHKKIKLGDHMSAHANFTFVIIIIALADRKPALCSSCGRRLFLLTGP